MLRSKFPKNLKGGYIRSGEFFENAKIFDEAKVFGNSQVLGKSQVYGNFLLCGDFLYIKDMNIGHNFIIRTHNIYNFEISRENSHNFLLIPEFGKEKISVLQTNNEIFVSENNFSESLEDFKQKYSEDSEIDIIYNLIKFKFS